MHAQLCHDVQALNVEKTIAVATAAMRNAKNGKELTALVKRKPRLSAYHERQANLCQLYWRHQHLNVKDGIISTLAAQHRACAFPTVRL
jgi:hypothetical protein